MLKPLGYPLCDTFLTAYIFNELLLIPSTIICSGVSVFSVLSCSSFLLRLCLIFCRTLLYCPHGSRRPRARYVLSFLQESKNARTTRLMITQLKYGTNWAAQRPFMWSRWQEFYVHPASTILGPSAAASSRYQSTMYNSQNWCRLLFVSIGWIYGWNAAHVICPRLCDA